MRAHDLAEESALVCLLHSVARKRCKQQCGGHLGRGDGLKASPGPHHPFVATLGDLDQAGDAVDVRVQGKYNAQG